MHLLIVDDNAFQRRMLGRLLRELGHEVEEAPGGSEALQTCRQRRPEVVFSDLLMPGMDGFALVERLGLEQPGLPIFVLSADIQDSSRKRALELGARGFLNKPATSTSLAAVLASL